MRSQNLRVRLTDATRLRRVVAGAGIILIGVLIYAQIEAASVRATFPLLYAALALQLSPLLFAREPDPFCPAAFSGLVTGTAIFAVLMSILVSERIDVGALPTLSPARREELMNLVSAAYLTGAASYLAGYYLSRGRWAPRVLPNLAGRTWRPSRLLLVTFGCALAFLPAYAYFQSRVGTSLTALALAEGKDVWKEDPTLSWMHRGIALGFIPLLLHGAMALRRKEWRRVALVGLVSVVAALLSVRLGTRGVAVFFLLNLLILVHYLFRRIPVAALLVGAFSLMAILNVLGDARSSGPGAELDFSSSRFRPGQVFADHEGDRQRLTAAAAVMYTFPERQEYLMGASWQAMLIAPVPRWVLPDKNRHLVWSDSGITHSLVGVPAPTPFLFVLFANFGWGGVIFGMAGWGAFHRGLQSWRERSPTDVNVVLGYSVLLLYFGPTLLQVGMSFQTVVPVFAALWLIGRRLRQPRSLAAPDAGAPKLPSAGGPVTAA